MDVLVVDDAPDIRLLVRAVLQPDGLTVAAADGGHEALAVVEELGPPRLVVLDVQMPSIDGWETLRRLRADPRTADVAVIMCTVKESDADVMRAWSLGCDGYLVKPFTVASLRHAVREVLARTPSERAALRVDTLAALAADRPGA